MPSPSEQERLIGESPAFLAALEQVSKAAPLDKPVLVVGERGTGKEADRVAAALPLRALGRRVPEAELRRHRRQPDRSELFGHEAGSFTGASRTHQGRFERADGGTLFLDELATTSALVQEKLLRVIEYGEFERVGGKKTLRANVRVVAATNEDLPRLAALGKFRLDLLDRLAFDVITLPPLRERTDDILLLAEHFAVNMAKELGRRYFPGFAEQARQTLLAHAWPGNLRELKNVAERAVYRAEPEHPVEDVVLDPFASPLPPGAGGGQRRRVARLPAAARSQADGSGTGSRANRTRHGRDQVQPAQRGAATRPHLPPVPRLSEEVRGCRPAKRRAWRTPSLAP